MVVDTSALVAILRSEPECREVVLAIEQAEHRALSAVSFVETSIVIGSRYGPEGLRDPDFFIGKAASRSFRWRRNRLGLPVELSCNTARGTIRHG